MNWKRRTFFVAATCAMTAAPVFATSFPSRPLRILVPFSAGALTDIIARLYAERLAPILGQPVIVDNKPGAGGTLAARALLAEPADGHTMLFVSSAHAANPALKKSLPYQTERDFAGLALLASSPSVVVVGAAHPAKSLADLVRRGRDPSARLNYGSAGVGSATHLAGEYLRTETGIQAVHVPFRGVQEAVTAVAAGELDMAFPPIALAQPLLKGARIRALAVTSPDRVEALADVPTVAESGYLGFAYSIWYALVTSASTPMVVRERLAEAMRRVGELPEVRERMRSQGLVQERQLLGDFDRFISQEIRKLTKLVRESGIQPE